MTLLNITDLIDIEKVSFLTEESFLISHSYNNGRLEIVVEKDNDYLKFSVYSPIVYFGDIHDLKLNNIGTIYFKEIRNFLYINSNGYFEMKDGVGETYKIFHNKAKIALGYKYTEYSHLGFFKGYSIKNAFLIGQSNINTITMKL